MSKIVMKFGGTSVADIPRIRNVASLVQREAERGHSVAVVVSAMAGETNKLIAWTRELSPLHDAREYDTVVGRRRTRRDRRSGPFLGWVADSDTDIIHAWLGAHSCDRSRAPERAHHERPSGGRGRIPGHRRRSADYDLGARRI